MRSDRLVALVYDELHALAQRQVRREHGARTLHATALVHEAYSKLAAGAPLEATNRAHFLATMARVMRQVQPLSRCVSIRAGGLLNRIWPDDFP